MKSKFIKKILCILFIVLFYILLVHIVSFKDEKRVEISDMASLSLENGWTIEMIETAHKYSYFYLLYENKKIATLEFSQNTASSLFDENTTAESFTRLYLGMHAELIESSKVALKKKNVLLTKIVANLEMSAADSMKGKEENQIWYFGVSENDIFMCAQLLDVNAKEQFEKVLITLWY